MTGTTTWAELISQPEAWASLIARLQSGALSLPVDPASYQEFLLLGSGSSYYLARSVADWMLRRGFDARAVASCEVMLDPYETRASGTKRLAIGFSRSGQSSELLLANAKLRAAGFDLLGISCTSGCDLLEQVDHPILIHEGREDGLVMLRSFTTMLITAQWLFGSAEDRAALSLLPQAGRQMLGHVPALQDLAQARAYDRFVYLGSGSQHPLTQEAALKVQEMAMATSEAYYSLDYRHGPKGCADGYDGHFVCLVGPGLWAGFGTGYPGLGGGADRHRAGCCGLCRGRGHDDPAARHDLCRGGGGGFVAARSDVCLFQRAQTRAKS